MNKMTDEQIIKALEYRCSDYECRDLVFYRNIFDLIDRQKAEIERLKNEVFAKEQECIDMQEQRDSVEYNLELLKQEKSVVKAEAVKKFAELVIKRICENVNAPTPSESYIVEKGNQVIDETLKEMEKENNA